jgi:rhodanese-related sulfurtransferase
MGRADLATRSVYRMLLRATTTRHPAMAKAVRHEFRDPAMAAEGTLDDALDILKNLTAARPRENTRGGGTARSSLGCSEFDVALLPIPCTVTPAAALDLVSRRHFRLFDVRPTSAYTSERIRDAHSVPYEPSHSFLQRVVHSVGVRADSRIIVVGGKADGERDSRAATVSLRELGIKNTVRLAGGHAAWHASGLPVTGSGSNSSSAGDCSDVDVDVGSNTCQGSGRRRDA